MAQILDVIPFYGKNFKTLPSKLSEYDQNLVSEVYEEPVKVSEGRKIEKRSLDINIPFIAQCKFQACVTDAVKIFPMRYVMKKFIDRPKAKHCWMIYKFQFNTLYIFFLNGTPFNVYSFVRK